MIRRTIIIGVLASGIAPAARAAAPQADETGTALPARAVLRWREAHGERWRAWIDPATGFLELLHGGAAAAPFQPRDDPGWFALARHFVSATEGMHGIRGADLVDDRVVFLPFGQFNSTDKMAVRLRQEVDGVPVEAAFVNVLMDVRGALLSLQSTAAPVVPTASAGAVLVARDARAIAIDDFRATAIDAPTSVGEPRLLIAQVGTSGTRTARLAWSVGVLREVAGEDPLGWEYTIDATTGAVLEREPLIHFVDVNGTLSTMATEGKLPDTASNPPTQQAMSYARISSPAGVVFADADGNFSYPGVNTPLDVTVEYRGAFTNVNNDAGPDHELTFSLQPNQPNDLLLNPTPDELVTAQANAHLSINDLRDWVRSVIPGDDTADFVATANTNIVATCNAFWNGGSVNFFQSGGSCPNTAYSTIVTHEMGHWLNALYGTGNGPDGIGEGNADVFACYVNDAPIVGRNFCGNGCNLRNANNTRAFCGDNHPGCYGAVHTDGEVWMGAAWKVRKELAATHGTMGSSIADLLFLGWMNAYDQREIKSIIEAQWLTLDDDDGNIDNGTPNYTEIDTGFRTQSFPGFDLPVVTFSGVTDLDDTQDETNPYGVQATLVPNLNPPVIDAVVRYRVNGGAFVESPMTNVGGDLWEGSIPPQASPAFVEYEIVATDSAAAVGSFPDGGPLPLLEFNVGQLTTFADYAFGGMNGNDWIVDDGTDTATTGIWERGNPNGTAAQPEDDHSENNPRCWFTEQGPAGGGQGVADVDGGKTTLLTPVLDLSALTDPVISYWRWFSNTTGSSPNDVFQIDVSNDGGATWLPVEVVGPSGPEADGGWFRHRFELSSILPPTSTVQMRFIASDLGAGSIVEAAVDDFLGTELLATVDCAPPTPYCAATPNSAGAGARIGTAGSQNVSAANFVLTAEGLPPNQLGLFFYGPGQVQLPMGNGFRCVDVVLRLPVVTIDGSGSVRHLVEFDDPPRPGARIEGGSSWNFQFWYRDPGGGGAGFNQTNAVEVPFCD